VHERVVIGNRAEAEDRRQPPRAAGGAGEDAEARRIAWDLVEEQRRVRALPDVCQLAKSPHLVEPLAQVERIASVSAGRSGHGSFLLARVLAATCIASMISRIRSGHQGSLME
jgi:hypothetical protein